jgi:hypothetical protein
VNDDLGPKLTDLSSNCEKEMKMELANSANSGDGKQSGCFSVIRKLHSLSFPFIQFESPSSFYSTLAILTSSKEAIEQDPVCAQDQCHSARTTVTAVVEFDGTDTVGAAT